METLNIVLFGPPGAGKGTQSEKLVDKYGLVHLSTGDILRSEIARGTELGLKAKAVMDRGDLVSDDIVIGMIESILDANPNVKGFIFDGFPRTTAQAIALDDLLQKKGTAIHAMLALEVDDDELISRLLMRGQDNGREDDKDESIIRNRINEYNVKTSPLKIYYNAQGKYHSIDGIGSKEEIFQNLVSRIAFIKAEVDLTQLETDIEHLDLTINDFEVADEIEPHLLLEIDAIKRVEAEEEQERKEESKQKTISTNTYTEKTNQNSVTVDKVALNGKEKSSKKVMKPLAEKAEKKTVKKAAPKKPLKKVAKTKAVAAKKKVVKKVVKKIAKKKAAPVKKKVVAKKVASPKKKAVKKAAPKKVAKKKVVAKKIVKKAAKKVIKKVAPKKAAKKATSAKASVGKIVKKVAPKKAAKKTTKKRK